MTDVRIELAERDDALVVAGLVLSMDRDRGGQPRDGFLFEYADAWLADVDRRPTWLACEADGNPVGLVQASLQRKLPSLLRPTTSWLHISLVYVRPEHRGHGLAERMLRAVLAWGAEHDVERYQLNAAPEARMLYERLGFTAPARLLELRA